MRYALRRSAHWLFMAVALPMAAFAWLSYFPYGHLATYNFWPDDVSPYHLVHFYRIQQAEMQWWFAILVMFGCLLLVISGLAGAWLIKSPWVRRAGYGLAGLAAIGVVAGGLMYRDLVYTEKCSAVNVSLCEEQMTELMNTPGNWSFR